MAPNDFKSRYGAALTRGQASHPSWAAGPKSPGSASKRHTWYAAIRVRVDVRGDVSDLTLADVDDRQRSRVVTVALLGTVASGAKAGTLRRLTRAELEAGFDDLLERAVRRHGLIPAGSLKSSVRAVYRHKEA